MKNESTVFHETLFSLTFLFHFIAGNFFLEINPEKSTVLRVNAFFFLFRYFRECVTTSVQNRDRLRSMILRISSNALLGFRIFIF